MSAGERRPQAVARTCPDTGDRDKSLTLTGFHYASRSQNPAGLLAGDVALHLRSGRRPIKNSRAVATRYD